MYYNIKTSSLMVIMMMVVMMFTSIVSSQSNIRMALLLSGKIDDLAHNYAVNSGIGYTEQLLNISGSWVEEGVTSSRLGNVVEKLMDRGYNFFITSDASQRDAAEMSADVHTRNKYLICADSDIPVPSSSDYPNAAYYRRNLISPWYMLGYIGGFMSNHIGMVVPGPDTEGYYSVNVFDMGARLVNPSVNVYTVATSSYNDADTANGAVERLFTVPSIDLVTQSQESMLVSDRFMNEKQAFALGSNGFPQSERYGETIYQSVVMNYGVVISHYASLIQSNSWSNQPFFGDFNNGFYTLDSYSFLVPAENITAIDSLYNTLQSTPMSGHPYFCSSYNNAEFGRNCISWSDMMSMSETYPTVNNMGYYAVPTTEVYDRKSINDAFIAVSSIQMFVGLAFFLVAFILKKQLPISYSNILFCLGLAVGGILVPIAILLWNTREKTKGICTSRVWMASLGYTFIIGLMIVKNTKIYLKFRELIRKKSDKISPIPPQSVYPWFSILLAIDIVLLAVYTGIGNPNNHDSLGLDGIGRYEYTQNCVNNFEGDIMLYIILVYHGLQLLYGCFISWKTRLIDLEEFEETHDFSSVTYLISFTTFIVVPLMAGITTQRSRDTIISSVGIFTSFSSLLIIFGSKFWKIYKPVEDDGLPQVKLQKLPKPGAGKTSPSNHSTMTKNNFLTAVTNPTGSSVAVSAVVDD